MGIMQDNLCHPYILSTTVLSDLLSTIVASSVVLPYRVYTALKSATKVCYFVIMYT